MKTLRLGILHLAEGDVALDVSHLREVARLPGRLSPPPQAPAWSLGTFTLRDAQMPTIDLGRLLGLDSSEGAREAGQNVAVVAYGEGRCGLLIAGVGDVVSIAEDELDKLGDRDGKHNPLTPWAFSRPGDERTIYVLDIDALMNLEGVMMVFSRGQRAGESNVQQAGQVRAGRRVLVLESGPLRLAVDSEVVREIATCTSLSSPVIQVAGYLGNQMLRQDTVPVFDAGVLLGQSLCTERPTQMLVLETGQGGLALGAARVVSMIDYSEDMCLALPGDDRSIRNVRGLLTIEGLGDTLLLDHKQLFAQQALVNIAHIHAKLNGSTEQAAQRDAPWHRFAFLQFQAGGPFVVPLDHLEAVLPMPESYMPFDDGGVFEGVFRHLERSVSLVDLRKLLGRSSVASATQVLVVRCNDGAALGFMVDGTQDISYIDAPRDSLVVRWQGDRRPNATIARQCQKLVSIGVGDLQQILSVLCLETLACLLTADTVGSSAPLAAATTG